MNSIGPRLLAAASMVERRSKIVDIGTDHAYLPSYLILKGMAEDVLACDIGEKPLMNARKTVKDNNLSQNIQLRLSDGLKNILPSECDEIIICGMGGNLISDILSDAPWIKRKGMHLILQPMTHSEDVRTYLYNNGFEISEEKYVCDNNKIYCCISAHFSESSKIVEQGFLYYGKLPAENEFHYKYILRQYERVLKKLNGLSLAGRDDEIIAYLEYLKNYYERRVTYENF